MPVAAYVTYQLLFIGGAGYQPHGQVKAAGMEFEGGLFSRGNRRLGYLIGDPADVEETVAALAAWGVRLLTSTEALAWSEGALAVDTPFRDDLRGMKKYVGSAEFDAEGRIHRPLRDTPKKI